MHNAARLAKVSKLLKIPQIAAQAMHVGPIAPDVSSERDQTISKTYTKGTFSMIGEGCIARHLKTLKRKIAVLYGVDTSTSIVLILQTCKDVLDLGYRVFIVVDATSSFIVEERNTGLQMLLDLGAHFTTVDSIAMELI